MPFYTYKCDNCSKEFTIKQSIKDNSTPCCDCGSKQVTRVIKSTFYRDCEGFYGKKSK